MDPNLVLLSLAMGAILGIVLGLVVSGEGYGWLLNAVAGSVGALSGGQYLTSTIIDMGPLINAAVAACAASGITALWLRA